ncbi:MAG: ABC transporter substrate-binding protein [Alphaproteobacteria bacterium]|nr:ABC transporter substrate-binding protein [Alphaproteobacteria bacterium]
MKKIFYVLLSLVLFTNRVYANENAEKLIQQMADDIMSKIVKSSITIDAKEKEFEKIFRGSTNTSKIAKFTLGRFSKTIDKDDFIRYENTLVNSIVKTWTKRFVSYAGETLTIKSSSQEPGKDVFVNSIIDIPNTEKDVEVIWRVEEKNGIYKLVDIIVEGISLVQSYKNEYTSVLQRNNGNIDELIDLLKSKTETPKFSK